MTALEPKPSTRALPTCARCGLAKPKKEFPKDERRAIGRSSWCYPCRAEYQRNFARAVRATAEGRARYNEYARVHGFAVYGLTEADYAAILAIQKGGCAGCGRAPTGRRLDIDHRHRSGEKRRQPYERLVEVRGLLCHRCNRALGLLGDDPARLRALAGYLDQPPAVAVILPKWQKLVAYLEAYEKRKSEYAGSRP